VFRKEEIIMMLWGYGYAWPMIGMVIWNLVWLGLLAVGIWLLIRWIAHAAATRPRSPADQPSAVEILRQRYARGEIDTTTFEQMRERLEADRERQPASHS
jgi:putative membrane protein